MRNNKSLTIRKIKVENHFNSLLIEKLINYIMRQGEKNIANKLFFKSLDLIKEKYSLESDTKVVEFLEEIFKRIEYNFEIKKLKFGGANYSVPVEINEYRSRSIAGRRLIKHARKYAKERKVNFVLAFFNTIVDIKSETGSIIKELEELHNTVSQNKVFMHLFKGNRKRIYKKASN